MADASPAAIPRLPLRTWLARPVRDAFYGGQFQFIAFGCLFAPLIIWEIYDFVFGERTALGVEVLFSASLILCLFSPVWRTIRCRHAQNMASAVSKFRTIDGCNLVLHADPELDPVEVSLFQMACEHEIAALAQKFGRPLGAGRLHRRRLRVYLFRTNAHAGQVTGGRIGYAVSTHWFIIISAESNWRELIRHELAHMFASRWNVWADRLLSEGLAVWMQGTFDGQPIDQRAQELLLTMPEPIAVLLGPEPVNNYHDHIRYYLLAGSFTGYVIRQFGWKAYRQFYGDGFLTRKNFAKRFGRHFGVPFAEVVEGWTGHLNRSQSRPVPFETSL